MEVTYHDRSEMPKRRGGFEAGRGMWAALFLELKEKREKAVRIDARTVKPPATAKILQGRVRHAAVTAKKNGVLDVRIVTRIEGHFLWVAISKEDV